MPKKQNTEQSYGAGDIRVLEGLEAVRLRPGMYIGSTGVKGLHHILWEIVDNGVDEIANGYADSVSVTINPDGSAKVVDNGRGIPVDNHPTLNIPAVQVVFTKLHAGGKFDNENYAYSGGLHGVGASVTNALSKWLTVDVYKGKTKYTQKFHSFYDKKEEKWQSGVPMSGLISAPQKENNKGTEITFMPDPEVFGDCVFDAETIATRLRELAFLNKGATFSFVDLREPDAEKSEYKYSGGIADYAAYLNENKNVIYDKPIYIENKTGAVKLELAIQHSDTYSENVFSYINNIPTPEGGTHETGLKSAFTKVMNDFARANKLLKEKEDNLLGEDYREGITAVLSIKMQNVQFEGQTKTKLGNVEAKAAVETAVAEALSAYFETKKKVAESIVKKAMNAMKAREAAKKAKEISRAKNSIENSVLVGKLAACSGREYSKNELFIVEGDSAGGSAKQARDRRFQAILPLRGKPLNAERKRLDAVLANEEIRTIISALGAGIGEDFDASALKYDKVIILSDADQDGAHIRAILLTFFFRYMKDLIAEGHVYVGMPPLYKVYKKDLALYCYDDLELPSYMERAGKGALIQRYKGLGEMNPEQLWDTTLNPASRTLMRVTLNAAAQAEHLTSILMGEGAEARKEYIIKHANFNKNSDAAIEKALK